MLWLAVDGAARSSRFPSAVEAALYGHSCSAPTVVGSWWHEGPVPCLLAHTVHDLHQVVRLTWDLDACSADGCTSSHAEQRLAAIRQTHCPLQLQRPAGLPSRLLYLPRGRPELQR